MNDHLIPVWLNNHITFAVDFMLVSVALLIAASLWGWAGHHAGDKKYTAPVIAMGAVLLCFAARIAYFLPGRIVAPEGEFQHPAVFEWRWLVLTVIAFGALYFARKTFEAINGPWGHFTRFSLYAGITAAGVGFSFLAWLL